MLNSPSMLERRCCFFFSITTEQGTEGLCNSLVGTETRAGLGAGFGVLLFKHRETDGRPVPSSFSKNSTCRRPSRKASPGFQHLVLQALA